MLGVTFTSSFIDNDGGKRGGYLYVLTDIARPLTRPVGLKGLPEDVMIEV